MNDVTCENNLCLYWKSHRCILNEISLTDSGICASCILISFSEDYLKIEREKQLKRLEGCR